MPLITIFLDETMNGEVERFKSMTGLSKKKVIELAVIEFSITRINDRLKGGDKDAGRKISKSI